MCGHDKMFTLDVWFMFMLDIWRWHCGEEVNKILIYSFQSGGNVCPAFPSITDHLLIISLSELMQR